MELLRPRRCPRPRPGSGEYVLPEGTDATAVLSAHDVPALVTAPAGAVALRAPRVALLDGLQDARGQPEPVVVLDALAARAPLRAGGRRR